MENEALLAWLCIMARVGIKASLDVQRMAGTDSLNLTGDSLIGLDFIARRILVEYVQAHPDDQTVGLTVQGLEEVL